MDVNVFNEELLRYGDIQCTHHINKGTIYIYKLIMYIYVITKKNTYICD